MSDDVFRDLPRLTWRGGIELPLLRRRAHFDHEQIRHKLSFRDLEFVDGLGLHNWVFEYTIPFRQGINVGPYRDLFVVGLPQFLKDCRDRTPGELLDPVLGTFHARCVSLRDESDPGRRDGDDVDVIFVQAPEPGEIDQLGAPLAGLELTRAEGARLDGLIAAIPPEELAALNLDPNSLVIGPDFLDQIAGFGQQIAAQGDRLTAYAAKYENKLANIERAMDAINKHTASPSKAPIIRSLRRVQDQVNRIAAKGAFPGQSLASYIVQADTTPGPLAAKLKMAVPALLLANPALPLPLIPAGTIVQYLAA